MCRQMLGVVHLYQWGLVRYEIRVTSLSAFQLYGTINKTSPATANMRSKIQLYGTIDKTSPATANMRSKIQLYGTIDKTSPATANMV